MLSTPVGWLTNICVVLAQLRVTLPVGLAGGVHAVVIGRNPLPWLKKPLDFGVRLGGEPLLGENKTFRGPLVMAAATASSAWALASISEPSQFPPGFAFLAQPGPAFRFGLLAGVGYSLGELPNSFIKRRLHIAAGDHPEGVVKALGYMVDQVDSVAGTVLLMRAVYSPPCCAPDTSIHCHRVGLSSCSIVLWRWNLR